MLREKCVAQSVKVENAQVSASFHPHENKFIFMESGRIQYHESEMSIGSGRSRLLDFARDETLSPYKDIAGNISQSTVLCSSESMQS